MTAARLLERLRGFRVRRRLRAELVPLVAPLAAPGQPDRGGGSRPDAASGGRTRPRAPAVLRGRKLRVAVAGHDFRFVSGVVERLAALDECELRIDRWRGFSPPRPRPGFDASEWADVVLCEWCGANAVWYSRRKRRGQRLIVHLHGFEVRADAGREHPEPRMLEAGAVDQLVTVSPHYRRIARGRLKDIPARRVVAIPNHADPLALDRGKLQGARFHLGLLGAVPSLKRLDLALDILAAVRLRDERFRLFVKTRMPWEHPWIPRKAEQRRYYRDVLMRIRDEPLLTGAVAFEGFGPDVPDWLRTIGVVLSTSDMESFHVAALEGMMSGAAGVVLPWEGAERLYGKPWVTEDADTAAARILELAAPDAWEEASAAARRGALRYETAGAAEAWARILVEDREPGEWLR